MSVEIGKYYINSVWHFTDQVNLEFIQKAGGILSLAELDRKGIKIPKPGGNDWSHDIDRDRGLHKFVHLTFISKHPMLYIAQQEGRIKNPIWIKIEPSIIFQDDVLFCPEVANKSGSSLIKLKEVEDQIDFEALFKYLDWSDPENSQRRREAEKTEILVPNMVPLDKILNRKELGI